MTDQSDDALKIQLGSIGFSTTPSSPAGQAPNQEPSPREATFQTDSEGTAMPLRVVVAAPLTAMAEFNRGPSASSSAIRVSVGDLDALFNILKPQLRINVPSVLHGGSKQPFDLDFVSLQSFRPDRLCQEAPGLSRLIGALPLLDELADGADVKNVAKRLATLWDGSPVVATILKMAGADAPRVARTAKTGPSAVTAPPKEASGQDALLDSILDMVDMGGPSDATPAQATQPSALPSSAGSALISQVVASASSTDDAPYDVTVAKSQLSSLLNRQIGAVLEHPEFRRLETSWRGLAQLLKAAPKSDVIIEVICGDVEETSGDLETHLNHAAGSGIPVTLVIVDAALKKGTRSLALWRLLAELGERQAVAIIASVDDDFLGRPLSEVDAMDYAGSLIEESAAMAWRSEAGRPSSRWLALGANPVLGRDAYTARSSRIKELAITPVNDTPIWVRPGWALGAMVVRSFGISRWPLAEKNAGDAALPDLPVRTASTKSHGEVSLPVKSMLATETAKALGRLGIAALTARPNDDTARAEAANTTYVTPGKKTYGGTSASREVRFPLTPLADQLFVSRVVAYMSALASRIGPTAEGKDLKEVLDAAAWELFADARPSTINFESSITEGGYHLKLEPRGAYGVTMEGFEMTFPLR